MVKKLKIKWKRDNDKYYYKKTAIEKSCDKYREEIYEVFHKLSDRRYEGLIDIEVLKIKLKALLPYKNKLKFCIKRELYPLEREYYPNYYSNPDSIYAGLERVSETNADEIIPRLFYICDRWYGFMRANWLFNVLNNFEKDLII